MNLTAFIFARGGSKGVHHKNIYPVAGKPLIAHSIQCALQSNSISQVIVSTDDPRIAEVSRKYGADVLVRPMALAADNTPEIEAWRHAIDSFPQFFSSPTPKPFISLPATSPLRAPSDIDAAVRRFQDGHCDILFGITPSHRHPQLNMVTVDELELIHIAVAGSSAERRQDVLPMYDITTCIYVAHANYVSACLRLMEGRVGHILIPPERALDIDTLFDMHLAELLLNQPYVASTGASR